MFKKRKLYRLQDELGKGVYYSRRLIDNCYGYPNFLRPCNKNSHRQPLPRNDQAISKAFDEFGNRDCLFAFTSKSKIRSWFCEKNWRGRLEHVGFHVLVLEAMSYASEYQAFYYGKTAVEIKRMKLSEVLGETYDN